MRADLDYTPPICARAFQFTVPAQGAVKSTLEFTPPPQLDMGLTFLPRPPPSRPKKRSRAVADIDGEHSCMQKKKRRLRLFLITSRLSPQFSHPATNIVDRGSSKIAVWAKQKALGRNLLRKAAILNRIRRRAISAREAEEGHGRVLVEQEREQEELELARLEFDQGSVDTYTRPVLSQTPSVPPAVAVRVGSHFVVSASPSPSPSPSRSPSPTPPSPPLKGLAEEGALEYRSPNEAYAYSPSRAQLSRRDYLPLPPSPLGISNYDAFDGDDDVPDRYARFDDEDEPIPNPYDNGDDDIDDTSFFKATSLNTAQKRIVQDPSSMTPPPTVYSDFNVPSPIEAVFGDYGEDDEGADAVWPSTFAQEAASPGGGSTSPDFPALFATSSPASKRTDSFATPPNSRPHIPTKSVSPNFSPATLAATSTSPNFTASSVSTSPNFTPSVTFTSPNFTPSTAFTPISPNFAAFDAPAKHKRSYSSDATSGPRPDLISGNNSDMDLERQRQRSLMSMRFGT